MSQDICQWIETHADFVPEKLAVRFEGREITYRQLAVADQDDGGCSQGES